MPSLVFPETATDAMAGLLSRRSCYWPRAILYVRLSAPVPPAHLRRIARTLRVLNPEVDIVGEAAVMLDVTHGQQRHGSPEHMATLALKLSEKASDGVPCAVGVAASQFAARIAAGVEAPIGGVSVITPWEARQRLEDVPADTLLAFGPPLVQFLKMHGATTLGDVARFPAELLMRRFGETGRHAWLAAQGLEPDHATPDANESSSFGHGKVLPPRTESRRALETYLKHQCEKVAAHLRRNGLHAGQVRVTLRATHGLIEDTCALTGESPTGPALLAHARALLDKQWRGECVTHVQVTALELTHAAGQLDFFHADRSAANPTAAMD